MLCSPVALSMKTAPAVKGNADLITSSVYLKQITFHGHTWLSPVAMHPIAEAWSIPWWVRPRPPGRIITVEAEPRFIRAQVTAEDKGGGDGRHKRSYVFDVQSVSRISNINWVVFLCGQVTEVRYACVCVCFNQPTLWHGTWGKQLRRANKERNRIICAWKCYNTAH